MKLMDFRLASLWVIRPFGLLLVKESPVWGGRGCDEGACPARCCQVMCSLSGCPDSCAAAEGSPAGEPAGAQVSVPGCSRC